jgi:hypothetical protein
MLRITAATAMLIALAGGATAQGMDAAGTGRGHSDSEVMPLSDGLVMVFASSRYDSFETAVAENPMAGLSGPCKGTVLIRGAEITGSGLCHYADAEGDAMVIGWQPDGMSEAGRTLGEWRIEGGTGKYANAKGGGRFDAGGEGADYSNKVTGEISLD